MLFFFEFDLLIDLLDLAPISVIQAVDLFHREQYQNFLFPNFFCPFQPQPQIIFSELHIFLEKLVQLRFQSIHEGFCVRT